MTKKKSITIEEIAETFDRKIKEWGGSEDLLSIWVLVNLALDSGDVPLGHMEKIKAHCLKLRDQLKALQSQDAINTEAAPWLEAIVQSYRRDILWFCDECGDCQHIDIDGRLHCVICGRDNGHDPAINEEARRIEENQ